MNQEVGTLVTEGKMDSEGENVGVGSPEGAAKEGERTDGCDEGGVDGEGWSVELEKVEGTFVGTSD